MRIALFPTAVIILLGANACIHSQSPSAIKSATESTADLQKIIEIIERSFHNAGSGADFSSKNWAKSRSITTREIKSVLNKKSSVEHKWALAKGCNSLGVLAHGEGIETQAYSYFLGYAYTQCVYGIVMQCDDAFLLAHILNDLWPTGDAGIDERISEFVLREAPDLYDEMMK